MSYSSHCLLGIKRRARLRFVIARTLVVCIAAVLLATTTKTVAGDWPSWRGPSADGVSNETGMVTKWDAKTNVKWKAPLPDQGNSTPIVSGDRVFVTCAEKKGSVRSLICFNRNTGDQLWKQSVKFAGEEETHRTNPYCAASAVTDGKVVVVWHGSAGVHAYSLDGKLKWSKDIGMFNHIWGNAASPVILDGQVLISAGPGVRHVLYSLSVTDGSINWQTELTKVQQAFDLQKKNFQGSWCSPVVIRSGGAKQIVLTLPLEMVGFNTSDGKRVWSCDGLSRLAYNQPLFGKGLIVAMSGYQGPAFAMKLPGANERGNLTSSHRKWVVKKNKQRVGSGVIVGDHVFILDEPGIMRCIDLKTGESQWQARLGGRTWSSMVYADSKLWVNSEAGVTHILEANTKELKVVAQNKIDELTRASPVFSNGDLFIRTYQHLYCIGSK
jgi:hypothetical protein